MQTSAPKEQATGHLIPKRNPQMQAWADAVMQQGSDYINGEPAELLATIAHQVAQTTIPAAQDAIARLGVYVHRIPERAAQEIARAQDQSEIDRAVDDKETVDAIARVRISAPWVDSNLFDRLREVLSNAAIVHNVMVPSADEAGL